MHRPLSHDNLLQVVKSDSKTQWENVEKTFERLRLREACAGQRTGDYSFRNKQYREECPFFMRDTYYLTVITLCKHMHVRRSLCRCVDVAHVSLSTLETDE